MVIEPTNLHPESLFEETATIERIEESLQTLSNYRAEAAKLILSATTMSPDVSRISQELPEGKEWLFSSSEEMTVISQRGRNYKTNNFRAQFIRAVGSGIEVLDADEDKITVAYADYSREKYRLTVVDKERD